MELPEDQILITNLSDGDTFNYSIVILKGNISNIKKCKSLQIYVNKKLQVNKQTEFYDENSRTLHFKCIVELERNENHFLVQYKSPLSSHIDSQTSHQCTQDIAICNCKTEENSNENQISSQYLGNSPNINISANLTSLMCNNHRGTGNEGDSTNTLDIEHEDEKSDHSNVLETGFNDNELPDNVLNNNINCYKRNLLQTSPIYGDYTLNEKLDNQICPLNQSVKNVLHLTLYYVPRTTQLVVTPVYIIPKYHNGRFQALSGQDNSVENACSKIVLGVKMIQCLMAMLLTESKSFQLEHEIDESMTETTSNPAHYTNHCLRFHSSLSVDEVNNLQQEQLWEYFGRELMMSPFGSPNKKFVAFLSCTHWNGSKVLAQAAIGGGGLALFGTGCLHTWPSHVSEVVACFLNSTPVDTSLVMDDSCNRGTLGGCFSTTLGSVCHEMGHTLDLGHSHSGIMGRGFDYIERMFVVRPTTTPTACHTNLMKEVVQPNPITTPVHSVKDGAIPMHSNSVQDATTTVHSNTVTDATTPMHSNSVKEETRAQYSTKSSRNTTQTLSNSSDDISNKSNNTEDLYDESENSESPTTNTIPNGNKETTEDIENEKTRPDNINRKFTAPVNNINITFDNMETVTKLNEDINTANRNINDEIVKEIPAIAEYVNENEKMEITDLNENTFPNMNTLASVIQNITPLDTDLNESTTDNSQTISDNDEIEHRLDNRTTPQRKEEKFFANVLDDRTTPEKFLNKNLNKISRSVGRNSLTRLVGKRDQTKKIICKTISSPNFDLEKTQNTDNKNSTDITNKITKTIAHKTIVGNLNRNVSNKIKANIRNINKINNMKSSIRNDNKTKPIGNNYSSTTKVVNNLNKIDAKPVNVNKISDLSKLMNNLNKSSDLSKTSSNLNRNVDVMKGVNTVRNIDAIKNLNRNGDSKGVNMNKNMDTIKSPSNLNKSISCSLTNYRQLLDASTNGTVINVDFVQNEGNEFRTNESRGSCEWRTHSSERSQGRDPCSGLATPSNRARYRSLATPTRLGESYGNTRSSETIANESTYENNRADNSYNREVNERNENNRSAERITEFKNESVFKPRGRHERSESEHREADRLTQRGSTMERCENWSGLHCSRRNEEEIFWSENCAVMLYYHRWLNSYGTELGEEDSQCSDLKFDARRNTVTSNAGLRLVELRGSKGLCLRYWSFPYPSPHTRKCLIIPIQHIKAALTLVAIDNVGTIVKIELR